MSIILLIVVGFVFSLVWKLVVGMGKLVFSLIFGIGALILFGVPFLLLAGVSAFIFTGIGHLIRSNT